MPNLDIKYINVDREIERSRNLEKQLDEFALSAERHSAVTPDNISESDKNYYSKWKARLGFGRELTLAEICCYTSHCQVLEAFLQSESKWLLILEDDIIIPSYFSELLDKVLNIEEIQDGCVNLYKRCDTFVDNLRSIELNATQARVGEAAIYPKSAVAIIWSKTAAFNFLKKRRKVTRPFDHATSEYFTQSGNGFAFDVSLLTNLQWASSIDSFGQKRPKARTGKVINDLVYGLSWERRRFMKTTWALVRRVNNKK